MGVGNGDLPTTNLHAMAVPMAAKYCTGPPQPSPYDTSHVIGYSVNGVTYAATSRPGITTTIFAPNLAGNGGGPGSNGDSIMSVPTAYETSADMNHQTGLMLNGPMRNIQMMQHRHQFSQPTPGPSQAQQTQQQQLVQASASIIDGSGKSHIPSYAFIVIMHIVNHSPRVSYL